LVGEQNICSTSDCSDHAISKFTMPQNKSEVQWNSMSKQSIRYRGPLSLLCFLKKTHVLSLL
jgi:hypothetical protein